MKLFNRYRDFFLLTYFAWAALAGMLLVGGFYLLTPLSAKITKIITVGSSMGIIAAGLFAFAVFFFNKDMFTRLVGNNEF